jgi:hypothetical protein
VRQRRSRYLRCNSSRGGGIHSIDYLTLRNTVVRGNHADGDGGGIYIVDGTVTLEDSILEENTADGKGGGIFTDFGPVVVLPGSQLVRNEAGGDGGAIASAYGVGVTIDEDVLICGNSAPQCTDGDPDRCPNSEPCVDQATASRPVQRSLTAGPETGRACTARRCGVDVRLRLR